ncbi:MAG: hypothetical protein JRN39_07405 [Nitrososphaerota archaeon]|nr:hypothetical protein [Nitrososphaerota archaeon]MDG6940210.1 hypothetical protein [Nitrososphaerota archaeon]
MTVVDLHSIIPAFYLQLYFAALLLLGAAGMAYDFVAGKKLAFMRWEGNAGREPPRFSASALLRTVVVDLAGSRQLSACGVSRRASHVLMLWGFILSGAAVFLQTFFFPDASPLAAAFLVPLNVGGLMVLVGGLWFLPLRADVRYEGRPLLRFTRADVFVLNLIAMAALGFGLEAAMLSGSVPSTEVALALYLPVTAFLFVSVPWTKFPHIFYKAGLIVQEKLEGRPARLPVPTEAGGE